MDRWIGVERKLCELLDLLISSFIFPLRLSNVTDDDGDLKMKEEDLLRANGSSSNYDNDVDRDDDGK